MPRVTVIMPTYNVINYIDEAINSILNQTFKDFELVVVDDCSSDGTYERLLEYSQVDKRIKLHRNEKNMKICHSLNKCLSFCTGEYVLRMDGDDISELDRIKVMVEYLDSHPEISLVGSQTITIDSSSQETGQKHFLKTSRFIEIGNRITPCVVHIWMARKAMYDRLGGYNNVPYVEDYDFLLRGTKEGYKYANCTEYLYKIRIREGNTASSKGLQQKKAVEYIKSIYFKQNNKNKIVNVKDFWTYIESSTEESNKYLQASNLLSKAITDRKSILHKLLLAFSAGLKSKYIRRYLFGSFIIRFLIVLENLIIHIKR